MKTKSVDAMDHGELILLFIAINQANEKNRSIAAFCQREIIDLRTLYHDAASDRNEKNSVFPLTPRARAPAQLECGGNPFN
jgi:hypothetical protein